LLALVGGLPPALGGIAAAGLAGAGKRLFAARLAGGAAYALLLLGGWAVAVLMAANQPMAERLGHALFDGQLYFSGSDQLWLVALGVPAALLVLRGLSAHLLLAHTYPDFFRIRGLRAWPTQIGFDLLAALALAVATMSLGVMGASPWSSFPLAGLSSGRQLAQRSALVTGRRHRCLPWRIRAGLVAGSALRAHPGHSAGGARPDRCVNRGGMLKLMHCMWSGHGFLVFQEAA
jgi:hypothetical protein